MQQRKVANSEISLLQASGVICSNYPKILILSSPSAVGTPLAIMSTQINQKEVSQMKKLITVTALGLTLGVSSLALASDHMELYVNGSTVKEVNGTAKGGEVETSPMSFYLGDHNVRNTETLRTAAEVESDENTLTVFGVRI